MLTVVILAAGEGHRMRSALPKVLHPLAGRPLILYVVELAKRLKPNRVLVVLGHRADAVQRFLRALSPADKVEVVKQSRPLGTAHAVLQAQRRLPQASGTVLILSGDVPLVTETTVRHLLAEHRRRGAVLTFLTARLSDPRGYGRVVRGFNRRLVEVVEEADADRLSSRQGVTEVNAGVYAGEASWLFQALRAVRRHRSGEYHLPEIIRLAAEKNLPVWTVTTDDPDEAMGINTRLELAAANRAMRRRIATHWMLAGVTIAAPETTAIDDRVEIGQDTTILSFTRLEGATRIGRGCVIGPNARLTDCRLGHGVVVRDYSVLTGSVLHDRATVGPFAHLRPGTVIRRDAKIGNFVEVKKSVVGAGSKANHLSYLGDAVIGSGVNIGAGTITCNYDGRAKHTTTIGDGVFVGSDAQFIAPVRVGRGAVIGAGSTITKDVPPRALAIGRAVQVNKPQWAMKRRATAQQRRESTGGDGA